jgi:hypothetical protein
MLVTPASLPGLTAPGQGNTVAVRHEGGQIQGTKDMATSFNPTPSSSGLAAHADSLPQTWKWAALFVPPQGFESEWRAWLGQAQKAEEQTTLAYWAHR